MASFGEELKRERELRDISLKEIAEATKVSIRFLEALEQNNFDILPGGIFNRGFIRAYARFIGVDGEEMVNSYLHELAQREGRPAGASRAGRPTVASAAAQATSTVAPPLSPGVFRPEQRSESRARVSQTAGHAAAQTVRSIQPEVRRVPFTDTSGAQGPSLALWLLVGLGMAIGVVIITVSMMGRRPADAAGDPHAEAVKARLERTSAGSQAPSSTQAVPPIQPDGGTPLTTLTAGTDSGLISLEAGLPPATGLTGALPLPAPSIAQATPQTAPGELAAAEPQPPPIPEHSIRIQAAESTRVALECGGQVVLDQEFWPGQVRIVTCKEPVVLSARNGGALQYALDGGAPAFLGAVGQQIEGVVLAPPPAPAGGATQATPGGASPPHAGR